MIEEWRWCAAPFLVIITVGIAITLLMLLGNDLYPKELGSIGKKRDAIAMTSIS